MYKLVNRDGHVHPARPGPWVHHEIIYSMIRRVQVNVVQYKGTKATNNGSED